MTGEEFFQQLDSRINNYDLLCHPFYQAWAAGQLTREDLRKYAEDYYHHVAAFPGYLAAFADRLPQGGLRRAVLANMADEQGNENASGPTRAHAEMWLDFVEGMGGERNVQQEPLAEITELTSLFSRAAKHAFAEEMLAMVYAYESQVPRVAREKARGLRERYGADEKSCAYFTLHTTADVYHAQVWRGQLEKALAVNPQAAERALHAGEQAAQALWRALDGIERRRQASVAA